MPIATAQLACVPPPTITTNALLVPPASTDPLSDEPHAETVGVVFATPFVIDERTPPLPKVSAFSELRSARACALVRSFASATPDAPSERPLTTGFIQVTGLPGETL